MFYFDRRGVSEGNDVDKRSASKQCNICHYFYFLNYSFKFQPNACNRCHDLLMMSMNLSDIAILNIKGSDYRCIISLISKNEAINVMQNAGLTSIIKHKQFIFIYVKMGKEILTCGSIEIEKNKFNHHKAPIFWGDVDIEKVLLYNKISVGERNYKCFIGYLYNDHYI